MLLAMVVANVRTAPVNIVSTLLAVGALLSVMSYDTMPELSSTVILEGPLRAELATEVLDVVRTSGFAVVNSAAAELTDEAITARTKDLYEFGSALGVVMVQSPRREMVEDVKDYSDVETTDDRGYRSGGEILPHSDPPTLIVLHCLHQAKVGGETSLVSVAHIVERMMQANPMLADELFEPLPDWHIAGQYGAAQPGPGAPRPVLARHEGVVSCVLYRPFIEKAAAALGARLSANQIAALDLFEHFSMLPELTIRFLLRPGQTVVLHNRSVLHARTDYVDWPEMHRRRHFLRLWIDAPSALPVHPSHELGDFFAAR
jgi:Taurine catabolism dioxygenase TauD, TfdA family